MKNKKPRDNEVVLAEKEDGELFLALYENSNSEGFRLFDEYGLSSTSVNPDNVRAWLDIKDLKKLLGEKKDF